MPEAETSVSSVGALDGPGSMRAAKIRLPPVQPQGPGSYQGVSNIPGSNWSPGKQAGAARVVDSPEEDIGQGDPPREDLKRARGNQVTANGLYHAPSSFAISSDSAEEVSSPAKERGPDDPPREASMVLPGIPSTDTSGAASLVGPPPPSHGIPCTQCLFRAALLSLC